MKMDWKTPSSRTNHLYSSIGIGGGNSKCKDKMKRNEIGSTDKNVQNDMSHTRHHNEEHSAKMKDIYRCKVNGKGHVETKERRWKIENQDCDIFWHRECRHESSGGSQNRPNWNSYVPCELFLFCISFASGDVFDLCVVLFGPMSNVTHVVVTILVNVPVLDH